MTAKDLRYGSDGVEMTRFEQPRRIPKEYARQQTSCGVICGGGCLDCGFDCSTACHDDCATACGGDWEIQANLNSSPYSTSRSEVHSSNSSLYYSWEVA